MLSEVLLKLKENGVTKVVYSEPVVSNIAISVFGKESSFLLEDVRSATFFAFGESKMMCSKIVVLVNENHISNCYTALIEAWMQRVPLILVSYNSVKYQAVAYLDRCLDGVYLIENMEDFENNKTELLSKNGPCLIRIRENVEVDSRYSYDKILELLKENGYTEKVFCYNTKQGSSENIINIIPEHKYGVLSKYIGYLSGAKTAILCIPDVLLNLESNVFNMRDFPKSFLAFVYKTQDFNLEKYQGWIESNHVTVVKFKDASISELLSFNYPTIVIF